MSLSLSLPLIPSTVEEIFKKTNRYDIVYDNNDENNNGMKEKSRYSKNLKELLLLLHVMMMMTMENFYNNILWLGNNVAPSEQLNFIQRTLSHRRNALLLLLLLLVLFLLYVETIKTHEVYKNVKKMENNNGGLNIVYWVTPFVTTHTHV